MKRGNIAVFALLVVVAAMLLSGCYAAGGFSYKVSGCSERIYNSSAIGLKEESVNVTLVSNSLMIMHNTNHFCSQKIAVDKIIHRNLITIIEKFEGNEEECMCQSKVEIAINPLGKGQNKLTVLKQLSPENIELEYEGEFR